MTDRERAKQVADTIYDKLIAKGLSHEQAISYMEKLLDELTK